MLSVFRDVRDMSNWLNVKGSMIKLVVVSWARIWRICAVVFES